MRINGALLPRVLLFAFLVSLVGAPDGLSGKGQDQNQPERPRFYALRVVSEKGVLNAKDALGAPDGRYAEILPGGQLVLLMEKKLEVFPVGDQNYGIGLAYSGAIVAKGETPALLEGWILIRNARGDQSNAWIPIGASSARNYDYGAWLKGIEHTDKIRITNTGTESLFVDAIIGGQSIH
jgi:hypothetical protein